MGASDREVTDLSIEARAADIEAVVDAFELQRFALFGLDASAAAALVYATRHPMKVTALVLVNCWPTGAQRLDLPPVRAFSPPNTDLEEWEFRTDFLATQGGDLGADSTKRIAEVLRSSSSPEAFIAMRQGVAMSDVRPLLRQVSAPTLVVHNGHRFSSFSLCKDVASAIDGARLLQIVNDPEAEAAAVDAFLRSLGYGSATGVSGLSQRELEVLRLIAGGKSNQQIADELVISLNTVRRHVSNVFDKTGVANRAEAASYAYQNRLV
jgi:DNA-binding CsgD family transcriptional regulator/pimeloyl-ACP methyl ester carboxylesterase